MADNFIRDIALAGDRLHLITRLQRPLQCRPAQRQGTARHQAEKKGSGYDAPHKSVLVFVGLYNFQPKGSFISQGGTGGLRGRYPRDIRRMGVDGITNALLITFLTGLNVDLRKLYQLDNINDINALRYHHYHLPIHLQLHAVATLHLVFALSPVL